MNKRIKDIIDHFKFEILPLEGTFFKQTYRSSILNEEGTPQSTAMIGMYCNSPLSFSSFHKLTQDETWHFYLGDPLHFIYCTKTALWKKSPWAITSKKVN